MRAWILVLVSLVFVSMALTFPEELAIAQAPGPVSTVTPRATVQVQANLAQLMRGILLPNSNVVFFAQSNNPADV